MDVRVVPSGHFTLGEILNSCSSSLFLRPPLRIYGPEFGAFPGFGNSPPVDISSVWIDPSFYGFGAGLMLSGSKEPVAGVCY